MSEADTIGSLKVSVCVCQELKRGPAFNVMVSHAALRQLNVPGASHNTSFGKGSIVCFMVCKSFSLLSEEKSNDMAFK